MLQLVRQTHASLVAPDASNRVKLQNFKFMKTRIILLSALIALFSITVASTRSAKNPKAVTNKNASEETRVNKGLAMEDKDQFN